MREQIILDVAAISYVFYLDGKNWLILLSHRSVVLLLLPVKQFLLKHFVC